MAQRMGIIFLLTPDHPREPPQDLFSHLMALLVSFPGENQAMAWILFLFLPALWQQAGEWRNLASGDSACHRVFGGAGEAGKSELSRG